MKLLLGAVLLIALVTEGYSLVCHSCNSFTGNCTLNTTTVCNTTNHSTCRSFSVNEVFRESRADYIVSGCGHCIGLISFSSGDFSRYLHTTCCSSDLCNDDVVPEIEDSKLNGLECHGCLTGTETGCSNLKTTVKCRGQQDHCVHTSGEFRGLDPSTYVFKGCASDFVCQEPSTFAIFNFDPTNAFYCCKDNMCNLESRNFTRSTTLAPTTSPNHGPSTQLNTCLATALLLASLKLLL
ncbi:urokinase plasminogen activator surface receptor-like [Heterodontus francisci]|uniref:urokinase plasminogen activator surface receptor-like n=1 Tax=Heterodontus francisci TaxID=7792 RepID=UPI00355C3CA9